PVDVADRDAQPGARRALRPDSGTGARGSANTQGFGWCGDRRGRSGLTVFERYKEKARRVIFFARYEASQYGSPYIETEHLLLGLIREDKALANRFLRQQGSIESIRKEIEARITIRERISTSVEVPLSAECKRILNMAGEEAERLGVKHVGTEHLLLGILREEKCFGAEI